MVNMFVDEQSGFRKQRSCQDHMYTLTSVIRHRKSRCGSTFVCFIDFAKTVDTVELDRKLLYQLLSSNIVGNCYNITQEMYTKYSFIYKTLKLIH